MISASNATSMDSAFVTALKLAGLLKLQQVLIVKKISIEHIGLKIYGRVLHQLDGWVITHTQ